MEIWKKMWVGVFFLNTVYISWINLRSDESCWLVSVSTCCNSRYQTKTVGTAIAIELVTITAKCSTTDELNSCRTDARDALPEKDITICFLYVLAHTAGPIPPRKLLTQTSSDYRYRQFCLKQQQQQQQQFAAARLSQLSDWNIPRTSSISQVLPLYFAVAGVQTVERWSRVTHFM